MKRLVLDGGSLPWTVIFAVIHNQRHDLSTLADNNGIEFLSNKGNKRERKRTEHSQSMLGQTCSDLVRLVQASLCNLKRSTPRTVSSLMMSPDKGSPFNSRWEVGAGWETWKKQTNLIITWFLNFPFLITWKVEIKTHRQTAGFVKDDQLFWKMNHLDRLRQHRRLVPETQVRYVATELCLFPPSD